MSDDSSTRKEANAGPERRRRLFPLSSRSLRDEHGVIRALSLPGVLAMSLLALVVFVGTAAWPGIHDAGAASVTPVLNPNGSSSPGCTDAAAVADPDWPTYGSSSIDPSTNPGQIDVGSGIISWEHSGGVLDWSSSTPIVLAVIVQGPASGNAYFYNPPESLGDTDLVPPSGAITLITFCYQSTTPAGSPTLTIVKNCVGGTGPNFTFDVDPNGSLADPTVACNSQSASNTLVAGQAYTVTESADPSSDWALTNRVCVGDDFTTPGARNVAFTPEAGDTITCTFTNTFTPPPVAPTLRIAKSCVGGSGPTFSFDLDPDGSVSDPIELGCNTQSSAITLVAGTPYVVTEAADPADFWDLTNRTCTGDDFAIDGDRGVTFNPESGDVLTCTFTNTYAPPAPTLVIEKDCVDGTGPSWTFNVTPNGSIEDPTLECDTDSQVITLVTGQLYIVAESTDPEAGWALTARSCSGDEYGTSGLRGVFFTPEAGDTIVCTFTNTFTEPPPAPTLVIEKDCVGNSGPSWTFDVDPDGSIVDPELSCDTDSATITLVAGTQYTITESVNPTADWALTSRWCTGDLFLNSGPRGVVFNPEAGDTVVCTFTNTYTEPPPGPTLVIEKDCVGNSGPSWTFDVNPDGSIVDPELSCDTDSATITLEAGTQYTITESANPTADWALTSRWCTGDLFLNSGPRGVVFNPEAGDTVVCTFTNTYTAPPPAPTLVIEKDCVGNTGPSWTFDVNPSGNIADPTLTCNSDSATITLVAGTPYTVTESANPSAGWSLTGRTCTGDIYLLSGARGVTFNPEASDTIVCTFTNTYTPPPAPAPTLVIEKDCVGGSGIVFSFDVSPNGSVGDPNLACNQDSVTITLVAGTTYTVTEGSLPSNWALTSRSCTGDAYSTSGSRGVTFTPEAGDTIVCRFINTYTQPCDGGQRPPRWRGGDC